MSYAVERKRIGRKPFQMVKLSLDYCVNDYGVTETSTAGSMCTAGIISTGQVQSATANTIELDAGASGANDEYNSYSIHITSGAGLDQVLRVFDYAGLSKIATMVENWGVIPSPGDTYNIIKRPTACYNTRATCQDTANYVASTSIKEIYLTESSSDFPTNLLDTGGLAVAIPCLKGISITPPKLEIGKGLGLRSSISITAADFTHHDRGLDKYVDARTYTPQAQGTFWGRLLARNPYYKGRFATIFRGYLNQDGTYDSSNFEQWHYIIEQIDGPDSNGRIRITAKDLLKLADDKKAQAPAASTGKLVADINNSQTTLTLTPTGIGDDEYSMSGTVRVDEELMTYTRSGDVMTIVRSQHGSTVDSHDADASVQECLVYDGVNVVDIVEDLLANYTGIDASYLDTTNWAVEKSSWLNSNTLTNIISKPEGVNKLLTQLTKENLFYMWWEPVTQLVKLKAIAPVTNRTSLDDASNIVADSMRIVKKPDLRISQVWVYYKPKDYTETKRENYSNIYIQVDGDAETDDEYAESQVELIESRWITSEALTIQLAGRLLALYRDTPKEVRFKLDNKDDVMLGDPVRLTTRLIQGTDGAQLPTDFIITEDREVETGTLIEYRAQQFQFLGNYARIAYSQLGEVQDVTSSTITLDTRTSKWEDPTITVPDDGPDVDITGNLGGTNEWEDDILIDHSVEMTGGAQVGFVGLITTYAKLTRIITFDPSFGTLPTVGDSYKITIGDYAGDYLLLETGDALLLEDGGLLILESASVNPATEEQKQTYAFIAPDSGIFDDGTEAYKIL